MRYIGDPDGARTRKLQRERLMTIPVCLQDLKALRSANRTSVLIGVFAKPMVGRVGLEPTRFRVSGLQPPAVATVPPADKQATFNNLGLEPKTFSLPD